MKVILISGKARSGKDTWADFLKQEAELHNKVVRTIHFADWLKELAKRAFNWNGEKDENGRTLLQNIGQSMNEYDPTYWSSIIEVFLSLVENNTDLVVIPDFRYLHEYYYIQYVCEKNNYGFYTALVHRNQDNNLTEIQKEHSSEISLDSFNSYQYKIDNNSNIADLERSAKYVFEGIYGLNIGKNDEIPIGRAQNFIQKESGKIIALYRCGTRHGEALWKCKCSCGNITEVLASNLKTKNTQSCSLCKRKPYKDLRHKIFGKLTPLYPTTNSKNDQGYFWVCKCACGQFKTVSASALLSNSTTSCGCSKWSSHGEQKIKNILNKLEISYTQEYSFPQLKKDNRYKLRFDFAIFNTSAELIGLIEYQGIQYFEPRQRNWDFNTQQENDNMKRKYCKENNIPLWEISYQDYKLITEDYIRKGLQKFNESI